MKIINIILGLGTAIILSALVNLGIKAFHPEPVSPYNDPASRELYSYVPKVAYSYPEFKCEDARCLEERKKFYEEEQIRQEEMRKKEKNGFGKKLRCMKLFLTWL